ncbi:STAS-like domain-containing protein [Micromonospora sp. NPDC047812]|uniref:STAS-like domain-containing protein n=1 Tax=Micromonospora sp. NPDC047812 TaxID=3155742 RepID=UPI0034542999
MKKITISRYAGSFGGDKDAAARIRDRVLKRALADGGSVALDFAGVELATQSFIHALLSNVIRSDATILERISFRNCNASIQEIIEIVAEYSQEEL